MAYFEEGSEPMERLESMVDSVGLRNVLSALEFICNAKAEHIRANWQDKPLAREWELAARKIYKDAYGSGISTFVDPSSRETVNGAFERGYRNRVPTE